MKSCGRCKGFIPASKSACPNCGAAAPASPFARNGALAALGAIASGGAFAVTLMACYGCPPSDAGCQLTADDDAGRTIDHPTIGDASSEASTDARAPFDAGRADADAGNADASDDGGDVDGGDDASDAADGS